MPSASFCELPNSAGSHVIAGSPPAAYTAGTWGPSGAIALIERDGRTWHEEPV